MPVKKTLDNRAEAYALKRTAESMATLGFHLESSGLGPAKIDEVIKTSIKQAWLDGRKDAQSRGD